MTTKQIAWRLREQEEAVRADIDALVSVGVIIDDDGYWFVVNFSERQGRSQSEKRAKWRERQARARTKRDSKGQEGPKWDSVTGESLQTQNGVTRDAENVTRDSRVSHASSVEKRRGEERRAPAPEIRTLEEITASDSTSATHDGDAGFTEPTVVHGKDAPAPVGNVRRLKAHVRGKSWAVDRFIDVLGQVYIPTAEERDDIAMTVSDNDPLWEKTLKDYKDHKWVAEKIGKLLGYYRNGAKWPDAFGPSRDRERQQTTGPAYNPGPSQLQNRRIVRWEKVPEGMRPIYEGQEGANA